MRPLTLTMNAFGTYLEETTIAFDKFGRHGLVLITGDTGAGKTTIFDAISYALFGETSSGNKRRRPEMLRSDFADAKEKTYVTLVFEHGGEVYTITRSPAYLREGYSTKTPASVEMLLPDGTRLRSAKDIDGETKGGAVLLAGKVRELLGISLEQFRQLAMLAQGDFLKLLHAETKEREKIFRTIFDTQIFFAIQEKLMSLYLESRQEYERVKLRMEEEISDIVVPAKDDVEDDADAGQDWQEIKRLTEEQNLCQLAELLGRLKAVNAKDAEALAALREEEQTCGELLQGMERFARENEQYLKAEEQRRALAGQRETLGARLLEVRAEYEAADKVDLAPWIARQAELAGAISEYDRMEEIRKCAAGREAVWKRCGEKVRENQKELRQLERRRLELAEKEKDYEDVGLRSEQNRQMERRWREQQRILEGLKEIQARVAAANARAERLRRRLAAELAEKDRCSRAYNDADTRSRAYMAGIFAAQLADGMPCPVCGSATHPAPAAKAKEIPDHEDVERAREALELARERCDGTQRQILEETASADADGKHLQARLCELAGEKWSGGSEEETAQYLSRLDTRIQARLSGIAEELEKLDRQQREKERLRRETEQTEKLLARAREAAERLRGESDAAAEEFYRARSEAEAVERRLQKPREAVLVELSVCERELEERQREKRQRQQEYLQVKETLDRMDERRKAAEAEAGRLRTAVKEALRQEPRLREADVWRTQVEEQKVQVRARADVLLVRLDKNRGHFRKLSALRGEAEAAEQKFARMKRLSMTANGNYKFETYIQGVYFDQIIEHANRRLAVMMRGQFELRRGAKTIGNRGLDLFVYDCRTARTRDVRTLSGGESFVASLAMAFGLSDIVQQYNGGVKLDTMFIDEGFGSLDADTLEQAVRILNEMSGGECLIGIISHVEELRKRIDRKIYIHKTNRGSTVELVY